MKIFDGLDEFIADEGGRLGPTDWLEVDQDRVDLFADATDDHQWIHVDHERAAVGPFGASDRNRPSEQGVIDLAALYAGCVALPLNPRFTREELRFFLSDSGARVGTA